MSVSSISYNWKFILRYLTDRLYKHKIWIKVNFSTHVQDINGVIDFIFYGQGSKENYDRICTAHYDINDNDNTLCLGYLSTPDTHPMDKHKINTEIIKLLNDTVFVLFMTYHADQFKNISVWKFSNHTDDNKDDIYCYHCYCLAIGLRLEKKYNTMISSYNNLEEKLYGHIKNTYNI
jgi:hypothetical protein